MCGTLLRFPTHGSPGPEPGETVPIHPGRKELTSGRRHQVQVKGQGQGQGQGEMGYWGQELVCEHVQTYGPTSVHGQPCAGCWKQAQRRSRGRTTGRQRGTVWRRGIGGARQSLVGTRAWKVVLKDEMAVARAGGRRAAERRGSARAGRELHWFSDDVGVSAGARPTRHLMDLRLQRSDYKTL